MWHNELNDEISIRVDKETVTLREVSKKTIVINIYEQNSKARKLCIEHNGCRCSICGFDFGETYGKEFCDIIHVHHVISLSKRKEKKHIWLIP